MTAETPADWRTDPHEHDVIRGRRAGDEEREIVRVLADAVETRRARPGRGGIGGNTRPSWITRRRLSQYDLVRRADDAR